MAENIMNVNAIQWQEFSANGFTYARKSLTDAAGGKMLGASLYKLMPEQKAFPFHYHYANEEAIFILDGKGSIRIGSDVYPITQGDYIALPKGSEHAHQVINTSDLPLTYLCFSTMIEPDVMVYPDSNKIGFIAGNAPGGAKTRDSVKAFFKKESEVGYYQDEQ